MCRASGRIRAHRGRFSFWQPAGRSMPANGSLIGVGRAHGDPTQRVDQAGEPAESDLGVVVEAQPGGLLHRLGQQGRPAHRERRVDFVLAMTGDRYIRVARDRHHRRLRARPELGHVNQQDGVGTTAADVAAGGQVLLLLGGEALAAVRADDQPVRAAAGSGSIGIVGQHLLAAQRGVEPKRPRQGCRRWRAARRSARRAPSPGPSGACAAPLGPTGRGGGPDGGAGRPAETGGVGRRSGVVCRVDGWWRRAGRRGECTCDGSGPRGRRRPCRSGRSVAVHPDNVRAGIGLGLPAGYRRARSPLMNGQPISTRMAWLSPVMSSTGLWKGSRTSWSPSWPSTRNRTPYRSRPERAHLPASQRRRQPRHQPRDHVVVDGVQVPQQARFDLAERVGPSGEQVRHADGLGAGGIGDDDGCDLEPQQRVPGHLRRRAADLGVSTCSSAGFGFSAAIRSSISVTASGGTCCRRPRTHTSERTGSRSGSGA